MFNVATVYHTNVVQRHHSSHQCTHLANEPLYYDFYTSDRHSHNY